jgi:hypothetical protein
MFRRDAVRPDEDEDESDLDESELDSFDVLPHGGMWSRPAGEDALRCAEHGLTVGEHGWLGQLDRDLSIRPEHSTQS